MDMAEIKKMSTSERLQVMESLWDSFRYEHETIETPEWHKNILQERREKIASGNAKFISLSELKQSRP